MRAQYDNRLRDQIKESVTMERVLELLGMEPPNREHKIPSIDNPGERTPSLHIYRHNWYDYSTGKGGDQIEFVRAVTGCTYGDALRRLSSPADPLRRERRQEVKPRVVDLTDEFDAKPAGGETVRADAAGWVAGKWPYLILDDVESMGAKVVTGGELWIPHRDHGGVIRGIKIRSIPDGGKYAYPNSRFIGQLYRVRPYRIGTGACILVEGESDLWCMQKFVDSTGAPWDVAALPSGAAAWKGWWATDMSRYPLVHLALDADDAGTAATERITRSLEEVGVAVDVIAPPGGRVAEAIQTADDWMPMPDR